MIAMEDCTVANGVFLYTKNLDSELMLRCLQVLLSNFPDIKFTSITADGKCLGYRVHFSNPDGEVVLAKKHLSVSGQDIPICPLTTFLTIHDVNPKGDLQLENHIREVINNKFGKLLYSIYVPRSPGGQKKNTKNWRVCIDVPEVKDLLVFDHEGFPEMGVWLPNKREKLKVTFYCRRCKKGGHIQQDCLDRMQRKASTTEEKVNKNNSNSLPSSSVRPFNISLDSTETFAEKIGREEIMKTGILVDKNQKVRAAGSSESTPEAKGSKETNLASWDWSPMKVKKETVENDNHVEAKDEKSLNAKDHNKRVPKEDPPSMLDNNQGNSSESFMDDDDDVHIIESPDHSNSSNVDHFFRLKSEDKAEETNLDETLSSPTQVRNAQFSFSRSVTPGPSNTNHSTTRPSISVEVTSVLSERLQDCINSACSEFGILNRQTLDAFLIHVKKKSNPLRVAKNYTQNATGLKDQLQHILKLYYNTPQTGTKDDMQFIKWLNGLVGRFEGTVARKRKRAGQNPNDTPRKK